MSHYGVEEWTDFVRGLVREENQQPMREHLAECDECAEKARLLEKVTLAARSLIGTSRCSCIGVVTSLTDLMRTSSVEYFIDFRPGFAPRKPPNGLFFERHDSNLVGIAV